MTEQILACPFQCVTLKAVSVETENGKEYYVECDCGARGPIAYSKNHAIEMWNAAAYALAKKDDEIEQLRKERHTMCIDYERVEQERDEAKAEIEKWKAEYVRIHQECDAFNRTNEEVFNENRKLKSEYAELRATLNHISDLILITEKQRDEAKKELDRWRDMVIPITAERDEARRVARVWYNWYNTEYKTVKLINDTFRAAMRDGVVIEAKFGNTGYPYSIPKRMRYYANESGQWLEPVYEAYEESDA